MSDVLRRTGRLRSSRALMSVALAASLLWVAGCGSSNQSLPGGQNGQGNQSPLPAGTGAVRGRVVAPNGQTPIAGATVSYDQADQRRQVVVRLETVTNANGEFELRGVPAGQVRLRVKRGAWNWTFLVEVSEGETTDAPAASTTVPVGESAGAARIAVVTGEYDHMEDVLGKLGFGEIDDDGELVPGSGQFDIYDGISPSWAGNGDRPRPGDLFGDATRLGQYGIVFVNCGANEEWLSDAASLQNLRDYVNQGGRLYVTDQAYDYIEQCFPEAIDFVGGEAGQGLTSTPEPLDEAQVGNTLAAVQATVDNAALRTWLQANGAIVSGGTIPIQALLVGWAMIDNVADNVTVWTRANIPNRYRAASSRGHGAAGRQGGDAGTTNRPLTVTFDHGQGRVLFTSYHTLENRAPELRPQELLLSYLVFEL